MAAKKILIVASNYGVWAEELQAPWDILKKAGHQPTLGRRRVDRRVERPPHGGCPARVVEVRVGEQDKLGRDAGLAELLDDRRPVPGRTGVHQHGRLRLDEEDVDGLPGALELEDPVADLVHRPSLRRRFAFTSGQSSSTIA